MQLPVISRAGSQLDSRQGSHPESLLGNHLRSHPACRVVSRRPVPPRVNLPVNLRVSRQTPLASRLVNRQTRLGNLLVNLQILQGSPLPRPPRSHLLNHRLNPQDNLPVGHLDNQQVHLAGSQVRSRVDNHRAHQLVHHPRNHLLNRRQSLQRSHQVFPRRNQAQFLPLLLLSRLRQN